MSIGDQLGPGVFFFELGVPLGPPERGRGALRSPPRPPGAPPSFGSVVTRLVLTLDIVARHRVSLEAARPAR